MNMQSDGARVHMVLIPGFGGFDVLGTFEYYSGVTPLFRRWRTDPAASETSRRAVLHYFDNLPTASVATRAKALRRYLAKRIARNEFQRDDAIALVGHSTGGLDIRQLLFDLGSNPGASVGIDGAADSAVVMRNAEMLAMIRRVVFLSVPQYGTNLADWLRERPLLYRAAAHALRATIEHEGAGLAGVRPWLEHVVDEQAPDLVLAARDVLLETDDRRLADDPTLAASAREAGAQVELWLSHIDRDFLAIEDLASEVEGAAPMLTRFDEAAREDERRLWGDRLKTRSFATLGKCPFEVSALRDADPVVLRNPLSLTEPMLRGGAKDESDAVYRGGYRLCSQGPFRGRPTPAYATCFGTRDRRLLQRWENDGIVNTSSMLWPDGEATQLVAADHADIIGHYRRAEASDRDGRIFHTYDLLRSGSGFDATTFEAVWRNVLDFCAST